LELGRLSLEIGHGTFRLSDGIPGSPALRAKGFWTKEKPGNTLKLMGKITTVPRGRINLLGSMCYFCITIASLGVVAAGCCSHINGRPSDDSVPVVISQPGRPMVPEFAFEGQLIARNRKVIGQAGKEVFSISGGLSDVRRVSPIPIVAATEQDGWFFYATATFQDATTHQPDGFISGCAVKRGSRQIIEWSVW
jgi:hypothetical protein